MCGNWKAIQNTVTHELTTFDAVGLKNAELCAFGSLLKQMGGTYMRIDPLHKDDSHAYNFVSCGDRNETNPSTPGRHGGRTLWQYPILV